MMFYSLCFAYDFSASPYSNLSFTRKKCKERIALQLGRMHGEAKQLKIFGVKSHWFGSF